MNENEIIKAEILFYYVDSRNVYVSRCPSRRNALEHRENARVMGLISCRPMVNKLLAARALIRLLHDMQLGARSTAS